MESKLAELQKKIEDLRKRLPAHSVKPGMIEELEDLEEELAVLKSKIGGRQPPQNSATRFRAPGQGPRGRQ